MERDQQGYSHDQRSVCRRSARSGGCPDERASCSSPKASRFRPPCSACSCGVIDAANRANVSIYTMDAAGLRAESEQAKIRDKVNAGRRRRHQHRLRGRDGGGDPLTKNLESNEDVLRQDPHSGLGQLAQETGGVLFENTNNLRQGFERIDDDLRNYYLLGYTPANDIYDGRFRKIDVKVKRPGVTIAVAQGLLRRARPGRRAGQRLGGPGARRARAEAAAERLPGSRRRAALPRARPSRPRARRRRVQDGGAHVPAVGGWQDLHVGLRGRSSASSTRTTRSRARSASTTKSTARSTGSTPPSRAR